MLKILLAEDDKDLNRYACFCLRNGGYEVVSCADGEISELGKGSTFMLALNGGVNEN